VIGVDFGTQSCVISQAKRGGIDTVLNEASKRQTPALVSFSGKQRLMGVAAQGVARSNFKNTVVLIKRFVGKCWNDPQVQEDIKRCPNENAFSELEGNKIGITVHYDGEMLTLTPEHVCAMLMDSLKNTAEYANEGRAVSDIVFSVPCFWRDRQRRAFLDAAHVANCSVLGLINDTTATALSYGIWKSASNQFKVDEAEYVMFVDMGYASLQVCIAAFYQGRLEIVAEASDPNLGGRDIDWLVAQHFAKEFKEKHDADPMTNPKAFIKLLDASEKAKQTLTPEGVQFAPVNVEFLMNEIDFSTKLTIEDLNQLINPLVERLVQPLEKCMEESKVSLDKIKAVEIVGGSTRVRAIKRRIAEVTERELSQHNYGLSTTLNADEANSRGCALRCAILSPAFRVKEFNVNDVVTEPITLSFDASSEAAKAAALEDGEEDEDVSMNAAGENSIVFLSPGTKLPKTTRITFRRSQAFDVRASYDEAPDLYKNLATFRISGMPDTIGENEIPRIQVDFRLDHRGLLSVSRAKYMEPLLDEEDKDGDTPMDDAGSEDKVGEAKEEGKEAGAASAKADESKGEEEKPKKKRKFRPQELKVDSIYPGAMTEDEVMNCAAREREYAAMDKLIRETSDMKNSLEEYVYRMRDSIIGTLREFASDDERSSFQKMIEEMQEWIYDQGEDETKEVYAHKLKELKDIGEKFVSRKQESEGRGPALEHLQQTIGDNLSVVNSPDEKYAHIDDSERDSVRKACSDAEAWVTEMKEKQADKNLHEDPVLSVGAIESKIRELENTCRPIVTKPKPKPQKKEPKGKNEEKKGGEEKAAEQDGEEPMDTSGEGAAAQGDAADGADDGVDNEEKGMDVD